MAVVMLVTTAMFVSFQKSDDAHESYAERQRQKEQHAVVPVKLAVMV